MVWMREAREASPNTTNEVIVVVTAKNAEE